MSLFNNSSKYEDFIEGNLSPLEEQNEINAENNPQVKEELYLLKEINQRARKVSRYGVPAYLTESIFSEIHLSSAIGANILSNMLKFSFAVVCMVFFNPNNLKESEVTFLAEEYSHSSSQLVFNAPKELDYPITKSKEISNKIIYEGQEIDDNRINLINQSDIATNSNFISRNNYNNYSRINYSYEEPESPKYSISFTQNNYRHYSKDAINENVKPFGMLGLELRVLLSDDLSFGVEARDDNFFMLTGANERDQIGWKNILTYSAAFSYDFYQFDLFGKTIETNTYYSLGLNEIGLVNRLGLGTTLELNDYLNLNVNYEYSRMDYFLDRSTVTFSDKDNIQIGIEYLF